jgi:Fe-S-cluster containining protein
VLYRDIDRRVDERARGRDLPCRAGCDACCHESVFLSAPEFLAVADHLMTHWPVERRGAVLDAMNAIARDLEDELEMLEVLSPGDERDEVAARVRFRCPMLDGDGRCGVYAVRELNARTFGMTRDGASAQAYGCGLTHQRLRVLGEERGDELFDAREARRSLAAALPGTERVHVYPWWFQRFGSFIR